MKIINHDALQALTYIRTHYSLHPGGNYWGINLESDGKTIASTVLEAFNGVNVFLHIAASPDCQWLTRSYIYACFEMAFFHLKAKRITAWIDSSNTNSKRFCEHLGFEKEAVLKSASKNGEDVYLYAMTLEKCRWIKGENHVLGN